MSAHIVRFINGKCSMGLAAPNGLSPYAGDSVSACLSTTGRAFLWGSGTNAQLGNAGDTAGWRNACLDADGKGAGEKVAAEDGNLDEPIPCRLESLALADCRVVTMGFGGQHTMLLVEQQAK